MEGKDIMNGITDITIQLAFEAGYKDGMMKSDYCCDFVDYQQEQEYQHGYELGQHDSQNYCRFCGETLAETQLSGIFCCQRAAEASD